MSTSRLHLSLPGNVDIDADEKRGNQLESPVLVALSLNIGAYERREKPDSIVKSFQKETIFSLSSDNLFISSNISIS